MSELNQEEPRNHSVWLKCFIKAMKESLSTGLRFYPRDDDITMLQQIKEMIQKSKCPHKEKIYQKIGLDGLPKAVNEKGKEYLYCQDCGEFFDYHSGQKTVIPKPGVTEEWIHNYTKKWWIQYWKDLWDRDILHDVNAEKLKGTIRFNFKALKDFIRSLIEEIHGRK